LRILIVAGGTGGHIYPAVVIARKMVSDGHEIIWLGSQNRMEEQILNNYNIKFKGFDIKKTGEKRFWFLNNIKELFKIFKYTKNIKPDKLFSTGGYISFYFLFIAGLLKIPYYLFEPNYLPGRVTKWFSRKAEKVFLAFKDSENYLKGDIVFSGTPVRSSIKNIEKKGKKLMIFGGSQGSSSINLAIFSLIKNKFFYNHNIELLWITGDRDYEKINKKVGNKNYIKLYSYVNNIEKIYKKSKFAITRAGALTVAEIILSETPAILIPYPHAKDNHQYYNAKIISERSGGIIIKDDENIVQNIKKYLLKLQNPEYYEKMRENLKTIMNKEAEKVICEEMGC